MPTTPAGTASHVAAQPDTRCFGPLPNSSTGHRSAADNRRPVRRRRSPTTRCRIHLPRRPVSRRRPCRPDQLSPPAPLNRRFRVNRRIRPTRRRGAGPGHTACAAMSLAPPCRAGLTRRRPRADAPACPPMSLLPPPPAAPPQAATTGAAVPPVRRSFAACVDVRSPRALGSPVAARAHGISRAHTNSSAHRLHCRADIESCCVGGVQDDVALRQPPGAVVPEAQRRLK